MIEDILPPAGQKLYREIYTNSYSRTGSDAVASRVAWNMVRNKFKPSSRGFVVNNSDFVPQKLFVFELQPVKGKELVMNAEGDELVIEAILADTTPRKGDGRWFTLDALQSIAAQINNKGSTMPDVEHAVLEALKSQFIPQERLPTELVKQKGMFNRIKAAVKDGKLWIKAWLDKRFQEIIQLYKFLSIEALATDRGDGGLEDPDYLGFTFTEKPRLPDATIAGL